MRKLVYLSLQNNVAQRVVILWGPKLYRTDDTVGAGGGVAHAGAGSMLMPRTPESGADRTGGRHSCSRAYSPGIQGEGDVGRAVTVPDFHHADPGRETGNLKN